VDPLSQFDVLIPVLQQVAANTSADQLDDETPCSEWQVRDLLQHLLGGASMFANVVRGEEPGTPAEIDDVAMADAVCAAIADLDGAFRTPGAMEKTIPTPFGDMPGEAFARLLAFDLLMHTWDLATSTDQTLSVPDEVVVEVDGFARAAIGSEIRGPETFGPEIEPEPGAGALERLVAFSGRSAT